MERAMEENTPNQEQEQTPELTYDYIGYGGIGKRDAKHDVIEDIVKKEDPEYNEQIIESFITEPELLDRIAMNSKWSTPIQDSEAALIEAAKSGEYNHHKILDAMKPLPSAGHGDSEIHDYLRSQPTITHEVRNHVFKKLLENTPEHDKNPDGGTMLQSKYAWVLHHGSPDEAPNHHIEDNTLSEDDVKFAAKNNLVFKDGRHFGHAGNDSIQGFLNRNHEVEPSNSIARIHSRHKIFEHNNEFSDYLNRQDRGLQDLYHKHINKNDHKASIKDYTSDSVGINKSAAHINTGRPDEGYGGRYHDHNVNLISHAIKTHNGLDRDLDVYTGLSKSTDPGSFADQSKNGRMKTFLPAFTSTTLKPGLAGDFAKGKANAGQYETNPEQPYKDIIHIKLPKGSKHGIYLDSISENSGELEYLLDHGSVVEHDAKPTIVAHRNSLYRVWNNGKVLGTKQSDEWAKNNSGITSPEEAEKHFASPRYEVRSKAISSKHATDKMLNAATNSSDTSLVNSAIQNPSLKPEHIDNILKNNALHSYIYDSALQHKNHNDHNLDTAINSNKFLGTSMPNVAQSKHIKDRHVEKILNSYMGATHASSILASLIDNPAVNEKHIKNIADNAENEHIKNLAKNRLGITEEEIQKYLEKARLLIQG